MTTARYPLEPSAREMRDMTESVLAFLTRFVEGLPDAAASDLDGALDLARRVRGSPPEVGGSLEALLADVEAGAAKALNTTGPGYLAYIPGGGLYSAAAADLLACTINRYVGLWNPSPALVQMEWNVVRWLCDLFGYPSEGRGVLTSGGSLSNFSAIVAARTALLPEHFLSGTIYVSEQVHHSVDKAAVLAGFPARRVRHVPCTPELRMDTAALGEMVGRDRAESLQPFMVVASAGTTNTGAVDPIDELSAFARSQEMWLHVDGAYGGFFQLTERGRDRFRGIEGADSITLDPHKGMFLPYGTGALVVRDGVRLRNAHHLEATYLQDLAGEEEIPNFSDYSPELSRDFRGLRVWMPLQLHGVEAFRQALDEKLDLTEYLNEELRRTPGFEVPWEPELSIVAFRYRPENGDTDEFNRRLLAAINDSRRVFLSSTVIDGRFTLRACILCHRTHRDRIEEAVDIFREAAAKVAST